MSVRLFVSDVHLDPDDPTRLNALSTLLRAAAPVVDEIFVLGDLCEMWIGDDDDSALVTDLATLFSELQDSATVHFMPGNRDFLLGSPFAQRTGLVCLPDPFQLDDGTLLTHGDALCTDDAPYQSMRALLRSEAWQTDILSKSLPERRAFGANLRAQSKAANANKSSNIMDVNAGALRALLETHDAPRIIHGHTHRPISERLINRRERTVLGAWERCGWWALQQNNSVTLHCAGIDWLSRHAPTRLTPKLAP